MAAAVGGISPLCLEQQQTCVEDSEMKKKQVALMEKLRTKRSSHHKSWTDSLMKSIRTSVVDRRLQGDNTECNQVQSCLYTLQRAMKVISQQSLVERLELVARHQGLTFINNGSDESCVTLQADMFHIEIALNKGGGVREVKIAHQGDASICHELTDILSRGDFPEFTSHLEGLQSIYQVTGEKKLKPKVFLALQSLEKDLSDLAQFQNSISGVANYIHKSPLGILLPRTAGKPMKLIYFVSPYDLLDKKTMTAHPMTVEAITDHSLGRSVTVSLESGPVNKLQTMPLMSVTKNLPSFNGLTLANSANLPACFVLVLPQPVPVALSVLHKIQNLTKLDTAKDMGTQPLLSLILDSNSGGKLKKEQQLYVSLPDQHHCYFINGVSGGILEEPGVMVSRIPFTHPTHVPKILVYLRQQLLFNSILASCVRPGSKKDVSSCLVFEMTMISLTQMMVVFEHPAHDTMVTADIDLSDITSVKCHLLCSSTDFSLCTDDYASRVLQRCLSLPILLRCLERKGRCQLEKLMAEAQALAEEQARRAQEAALWIAAQLRQQQARLPPTMPSKGRPPPPQPPPLQLTPPTYPPTPSPITSNPSSVGDFPTIAGSVDFLGSSPPAYATTMMGLSGESQEKQNNPLLVNLLDSDRGIHGVSLGTSQGQGSGNMTVSESPMLSRLLDDNISVATNIPAPVAVQPPQPKAKGGKGRKRRSQSDLATGRSPKHRLGDNDGMERFSSIDFESSSSPFEASLGGPGSLAGFHHQMGHTPPSRPSSHGHMSSVIDLTEENMPESSLKKLVNFSNFMPSQDARTGNSTPESELHALLNEQDLGNSPSAGLKSNQMTGSKNENASTSLEGFLIGSGEVGKASLPDPGAVHYPKLQTASSCPSSSASMAAFLGHGQATSPQNSDLIGISRQTGGLQNHRWQNCKSSRHRVFSDGCTNKGISPATFTSDASTSPKVVSSGSMTEAVDVKPPLPPWKKDCGIKVDDSEDEKPDHCEKFDFMGQTVPSSHLVITSSTTSPCMEGENLTAPKVRLKLHPFRTSLGKSQSLDSGVVRSPSSAGSKSSSSNTFDFCSEDDDDDVMPKNFTPTEHLAVYSSSPTRLQISTKGRPSNILPMPESPLYKPEKYKRKDKSSGNSKRKKDRESKKEKKKKRSQLDLYHSPIKGPMYRASTIETDHKIGTKLKILVSKTSSPIKEHYHVDRHSEKAERFTEKVNNVFKRQPTVEKLVLQKQDIGNIRLADDEDVYYSTSGKSSLKINKNGMIRISNSNTALSKVDPKLAKATIRLEPLNLNSSTTTSVCLSASGRKPDRCQESKYTTSPVSTPTTGPISVTNILPGVPTASSVASLPPIPKISKACPSTSDSTTNTSSSNSTSTSVLANKCVKNTTMNSNSRSASPVSRVSGSLTVAGSHSLSSSQSQSSKSSGIHLHKASHHRLTHLPPTWSGQKIPENTRLHPKILKASGNLSHSSHPQKTSFAGNHGWQKESSGSSHVSSAHNNKDLSCSDQTGTSLHDHTVMKNMLNQNRGALKDSRINGNIPRSISSLKPSHLGSVKKPPNLQIQAAYVKLENPSNCHEEHHRLSPVHKASSVNRSSDLHKKPVQGNKVSQKSFTPVSNISPKDYNSSDLPQSPSSKESALFKGAGNQDQGQKQSISQVQSVSGNGLEMSSRISEDSLGDVRNQTANGGDSGDQPSVCTLVNNSKSSSKQKPEAESSPFTSSSHSMSAPSDLSAASYQVKDSHVTSVTQSSVSIIQYSSPQNSNKDPVDPCGSRRPSSSLSEHLETLLTTDKSTTGSPNYQPDLAADEGDHQLSGLPLQPCSADSHQIFKALGSGEPTNMGLQASPLGSQNSPLKNKNSPLEIRNSPLAGQNSPNSSLVGQNFPLVSVNTLLPCRNSSFGNQMSPVGNGNCSPGKSAKKSEDTGIGVSPVASQSSQSVGSADTILQDDIGMSNTIASPVVSIPETSVRFHSKSEASPNEAVAAIQNSSQGSNVSDVPELASDRNDSSAVFGKEMSCNVTNSPVVSESLTSSSDCSHITTAKQFPDHSVMDTTSSRLILCESASISVCLALASSQQANAQSGINSDLLSPSRASDCHSFGSMSQAPGTAATNAEPTFTVCASQNREIKDIALASNEKSLHALAYDDNDSSAVSKGGSTARSPMSASGLNITETNLDRDTTSLTSENTTKMFGTALDCSVKAVVAHTQVNAESISTSCPELSSPSPTKVSSLPSSIPCTTTSSPSSECVNSIEMVSGPVSAVKNSLSGSVNSPDTKLCASELELESVGNGGIVSLWESDQTCVDISEERGNGDRDEGLDSHATVANTQSSFASMSSLSVADKKLKSQHLESQISGSVATTVDSAPARITPHASSVSQSLCAEEMKSKIPVSREVSQDLSSLRAKVQTDPLSVTGPPSLTDTCARVSSKEMGPAVCESPTVGSMKTFAARKFNGECGRDKAGKDVFIACTPRSPLIEEISPDSNGGAPVNVSRKCYANRPTLPTAASPLAKTGSQESQLATSDCSENQGNVQPTSFPTSRTIASTSVTYVYPTTKRVGELSGKTVIGRTSPSLNTWGVKSSARSSPLHKPSPSHTCPSPGTNSPCNIDDDLMDAALMGFSAS